MSTVTEPAPMFVARKLPRHAGPSGWVQMLPPRKPYPALDGTVSADVVVIGAGFAGLAAARQLSLTDPRLKVVVLEAGELGDGAASRNSGFIIDLPHEVSSDDYAGAGTGATRPDITVNRSAIAMAKTLAAEIGWGPDVFDPCGKYNVAIGAQGDAHIASYARQLDRLGEPYRLLDARAVAELTGSPAFTSALYAPGTVIIQPAAYIRGVAEHLSRTLRIYEQSPALSLDPAGGGWVVKTPKGRVNAGRIILATNGHAESFGFFPGRLLHVFTYASMTEPFEPGRLPGQRSWAATPAFPMGTTVRRVRGTDGDRILIRSRYSYHAGLETTARDVERAGRVHDRKFGDRFPALAGVRMQYRWGGAMALTWNGVPAFGEIEKNLFSACACNGVGATKATASGLAAADAALGRQTQLTAIFRAFASPRRLPPQPFRSIGVSANLSLREWRAGRE